jgi:SAM-dependent methyltransferase
MDVIEYKGKPFPAFQAQGFATQFAIPYAKHFCKGVGYDIGCNRAEWVFPGAKGIDLNFDDEWDAFNLPDGYVDYIYSSHCLEHIHDWVNVLDYWNSKLRIGGVLFLYLPHYSQTYWRPWNNTKHKHIFTPEIIYDYMLDRGYINIFTSDQDLNNSFMVVGERS